MDKEQKLKENTNLMERNFPFNIFHNSHAEHNVLGLHWHDNIEILLMHEGHAIFHIDSQAIEALPGDILFVNSGQLHSGYSLDHHRVVYDAVVFHPSLLANQSPDPYQLRVLSPFIDGQWVFPGKIAQENPDYPFFQRPLQCLVSEFRDKKPGHELVIKSLLIQMTVAVYRSFYAGGKNQDAYERYAKETERFKKLITHIAHNYEQRITIQKAAAIVNLSPTYFCKAFKRATGRSFVEYLNLYRINVAAEMLRTSELPVTEIASKIGFCNINYFDKVFKQYKNVTPSRYKST